MVEFAYPFFGHLAWLEEGITFCLEICMLKQKRKETTEMTVVMICLQFTETIDAYIFDKKIDSKRQKRTGKVLRIAEKFNLL